MKLILQCDLIYFDYYSFQKHVFLLKNCNCPSWDTLFFFSDEFSPAEIDQQVETRNQINILKRNWSKNILVKKIFDKKELRVKKNQVKKFWSKPFLGKQFW